VGKRGHCQSRELYFFCGKGKENSQLRTVFFVQYRILSAMKGVGSVSDTMSYTRIVLRGRWCNIIVLNVHAPSEGKSDDSKERFYEELE